MLPQMTDVHVARRVGSATDDEVPRSWQRAIGEQPRQPPAVQLEVDQRRRPSAMPAPAIAAPIAALNVSNRTMVGFARAGMPSRSSQVDQAFSRLLP